MKNAIFAFCFALLAVCAVIVPSAFTTAHQDQPTLSEIALTAPVSGGFTAATATFDADGVCAWHEPTVNETCVYQVGFSNYPAVVTSVNSGAELFNFQYYPKVDCMLVVTNHPFAKWTVPGSTGVIIP